jgi:hypothetical protein
VPHARVLPSERDAAMSDRFYFYGSLWLGGTRQLSVFDRGIYADLIAIGHVCDEWLIDIGLAQRMIGCKRSALEASIRRLEESRKVLRSGSQVSPRRLRSDLQADPRSKHFNKTNELDQPLDRARESGTDVDFFSVPSGQERKNTTPRARRRRSALNGSAAPHAKNTQTNQTNGSNGFSLSDAPTEPYRWPEDTTSH